MIHHLVEPLLLVRLQRNTTSRPTHRCSVIRDEPKHYLRRVHSAPAPIRRPTTKKPAQRHRSTAHLPAEQPHQATHVRLVQETQFHRHCDDAPLQFRHDRTVRRSTMTRFVASQAPLLFALCAHPKPHVLQRDHGRVAHLQKHVRCTTSMMR